MLKMQESGVPQGRDYFIPKLTVMVLCVMKGALMEMSGWWKELTSWKDVWRSAIAMPGAQCVIMGGAQLMLELFADS